MPPAFVPLEPDQERRAVAALAELIRPMVLREARRLRRAA